MTHKEIIDNIIKKEREQYEEYRRIEYTFVSHNIPFGYGYFKYCKEIKRVILKIVEARGKWKSLFDVLSVLQIAVTEGKKGAEYHSKTYNWLEGIK